MHQNAAHNLSELISRFAEVIGLMMAGWTDREQALHDMITGTLRLKKSHSDARHAELQESQRPIAPLNVRGYPESLLSNSVAVEIDVNEISNPVPVPPAIEHVNTPIRCAF